MGPWCSKVEVVREELPADAFPIIGGQERATSRLPGCSPPLASHAAASVVPAAASSTKLTHSKTTMTNFSLRASRDSFVDYSGAEDSISMSASADGNMLLEPLPPLPPAGHEFAQAALEVSVSVREREGSPFALPNASASAEVTASSEASGQEKEEAAERAVGPRVDLADGDFIPHDALRWGDIIGSGSFGDVYLCNKHGQDLAVKRMKLDTTVVMNTLKNEVALLKSLRHENIIRFMGASLKRPWLYLVTEYVRGQSLEKLLDSTRSLSIQRYLHIALGIAKGLGCMHYSAVIHRDLKPSNILVDNYENAKICDLGLSHSKQSAIRPALYGRAGTWCYMAPEVLADREYSLSADVFSFAIILAQLSTGRFPYSAMGIRAPSEAWKKFMMNPDFRPLMGNAFKEATGLEPILAVPQMPQALIDLIEKCWRQDPAARPSIDDVAGELEAMQSQLADSRADDLQFVAALPERAHQIVSALHTRQDETEHLLNKAHRATAELRKEVARLKRELRTSKRRSGAKLGRRHMHRHNSLSPLKAKSQSEQLVVRHLRPRWASPHPRKVYTYPALPGGCASAPSSAPSSDPAVVPGTPTPRTPRTPKRRLHPRHPRSVSSMPALARAASEADAPTPSLLPRLRSRSGFLYSDNVGPGSPLALPLQPPSPLRKKLTGRSSRGRSPILDLLRSKNAGPHAHVLHPKPVRSYHGPASAQVRAAGSRSHVPTPAEPSPSVSPAHLQRVESPPAASTARTPSRSRSPSTGGRRVCCRAPPSSAPLRVRCLDPSRVAHLPTSRPNPNPNVLCQ